MRSLEQSLQSKRSILLGKRKILGKYFQGNWSYLKWDGFPHPLPSVDSVHTQTHTSALETQIHIQMAFLQTQASSLGLISVTPLPPDRLTRLFVFPMPTSNSNISPPNWKGLCVPGQQDKKGRKISTNHHLHQNKNKQTQEKGAAKEVQGFFCTRNPSHVASGSLPAKSNMDLYTKKVLSLT